MDLSRPKTDFVERIKPTRPRAINRPRETHPTNTSAIYHQLPHDFPCGWRSRLLPRVLSGEFEHRTSLERDCVGQLLLDLPHHSTRIRSPGGSGSRSVHAGSLRGHVSNKVLAASCLFRETYAVSTVTNCREFLSQSVRSDDEP